MTKSRKISLWVVAVLFLVGICLIGRTILSGQVKAQGKKPPAPSYLWQVRFPENSLDYYGTNPYLYGTKTFVNGPTAIVSVTKNTDKTFGLYYYFVLNLLISDSGKIMIRQVAFNPDTYTIGHGTPCLFPPSTACLSPTPYIFSCMECLLNYPGGHPIDGYLQMDVTFKILYDIENNLAPGSKLRLDVYDPVNPIRTDIYIRINENRPYSELFGAKTFANDGGYGNSWISRSSTADDGGNTWTFDVSELMRFYQSYTVQVGGNSNRVQGYDAGTARTIDPFKLSAVWTRTLVK